MADPHSQHSSLVTTVALLPNHPIWRAVLREPQGTPKGLRHLLHLRAQAGPDWAAQPGDLDPGQKATWPSQMPLAPSFTHPVNSL